MSSSLTEPLISPQQQEQNNDSPIATSAPPKSKNINIILTYTFFTFSARSLWNQSVLSAFVYLLKSNDPKYVGLLTAIMGIAQLLISFPSGVLADRYRRDTMLQIGSVIGVIAATSTYIATKAMSFAMLGMALFIWGLFWGITNTSVSALFADSILDGDRSNYFTQRMVVQVLGNTCGPLGALIMFFKLGDDWTTEECAVVICAGQCLAVPALVLLCFMNDDYCISSIGDDDDDDDVDDDDDDDNDEMEKENDKYASPPLPSAKQGGAMATSSDVEDVPLPPIGMLSSSQTSSPSQASPVVSNFSSSLSSAALQALQEAQKAMVFDPVSSPKADVDADEERDVDGGLYAEGQKYDDASVSSDSSGGRKKKEKKEKKAKKEKKERKEKKEKKEKKGKKKSK
jgi:hypothetical protein